MPLKGPRPLPDPMSASGSKELPRRPDDHFPNHTDHTQETLQEPLSSTPNPFPDLTTGYLDPYLHTPAPPPSSYSGLGPRRQASVGSRSLAPSDSASNFQRDDQEEDQERDGFDGSRRGLRVVGEEDEGQGDLGRGRDGAHGDPFTILRGGGHHPDGPAGYGRSEQRREGRHSTGLSYIDEEGDYYRTERDRPGSDYESLSVETMRGRGAGKKDGVGEEGESLVRSAAVPAGSFFEQGYAKKNPHYPPTLNSEYSGTRSKWYQSLLGLGHGKFPLEQQVENKRRGMGRQRWPFVCWTLTLAMCSVMVWELISQNQAQGTPIAIKPNFNYMVGPSSGVLINDGARFVPCMKRVPDLPVSFPLACLNDTSNPPTTACSLGSICGFGGISEGETPNQWFRFILPIFLHVGLVHLLFNMVAQLTIGAQVEREMGSIGFLITYFAGGIYGFILGGNFSRTGIPSAGASGALFACSGVMVVDLVLHWSLEDRPRLKAFFLFLEFGVGIAIGYIPYAVDGLSHLGGYAMGLLCGMILMPAILPTRRQKIVVWVLRVIALVLVILAFTLTIRNFYTEDPNAACKWCKYLSCIPTKSNNHCSGTGLIMPDTNSTLTRRTEDL